MVLIERLGLIATLVLLLGVSADSCQATATSVDGRGEGTWTVHAVVYGSVISFQRERSGAARIVIQADAVLTGAGDAASQPIVDTKIPWYQVNHVIGETPPAPGTPVVALLHWGAQKGLKLAPDQHYYELTPEDREWQVFAGVVEFFPEKRSLIAVSGFDDPVVKKLIADLRRLRQRVQ